MPKESKEVRFGTEYTDFCSETDTCPATAGLIFDSFANTAPTRL